jgi:hypothetical protein
VASVARSRRHTLILATYFGLGIAMCIASLLSWSSRRDLTLSQPEPYLLALPLAMTFFLVFGIRAAILIPTGRLRDPEPVRGAALRASPSPSAGHREGSEMRGPRPTPRAV